MISLLKASSQFSVQIWICFIGDIFLLYCQNFICVQGIGIL